MYPLRDVTANFAGGGPILDVSGLVAYGLVGGALGNATRLDTGALITFAAPFINSYSRNTTPSTLYVDGVGFCGPIGTRSYLGGNIPQFQQLNPAGGDARAMEWNNFPPIQAETISLISYNEGGDLGSNFTAMITVPTAQLNTPPDGPYNLDGPLMWAQGPANGFYLPAYAPIFETTPYTGPTAFAIIGGGAPGINFATFLYSPTWSSGEGGVGVIQEPTYNSIKLEPDVNHLQFPGLAFPETFNPANGGTGLFSDMGAYRGYCFQFPNNGSLSICGVDPGGTALDDGGQVTHPNGWNGGGITDSVPYDIQYGPGAFYTPEFPPVFTLAGGPTVYDMSGGGGVMRTLSMVNGNPTALVQVPTQSGPDAIVLFQGGFRVTILKPDTLNYKRSLTYGMAGPGTASPGSPSGYSPSLGVIGVGPSEEFEGGEEGTGLTVTE
jgi:hypothetical protein